MTTRPLSVAAAVLVLATVAACGSSGSNAASTTTAAPATTSAASTTSAVATTTSTTPPMTTTEAPTTTAVEAWTERDLVYATRVGSGEPVTLDIYFPAEPADAPIVIGDYPDLVEEGMIVVARHLYGADGATGPEPLVANRNLVRRSAEHTDCTIRFARARAAELGNEDPTVVLTGFSNGGGLAAHVALFGDTLETRWEEFAAAGGPPRQLDCTVPGGSTDVEVLIGMEGAYDVWVPIFDGAYGRAYQQERDPEKQQFLASPIGTNPDLKVRLIHGTEDFVPLADVEEFAAILQDAGYDVQLTTWAAGHDEPPIELLLSVLREALGAAGTETVFDFASDNLCEWITAEDMNRILTAAQEKAGTDWALAPFDCHFDEVDDPDPTTTPHWSAHDLRVDLAPSAWLDMPTAETFSAHEMLDESITTGNLEQLCSWLEMVRVQLSVEGHENEVLWFRLYRNDPTSECGGNNQAYQARVVTLGLAVADAMLRAMNWVD